jgi:hypothetical protein
MLFCAKDGGSDDTRAADRTKLRQASTTIPCHHQVSFAADGHLRQEGVIRIIYLQSVRQLGYLR